MIRSGNGLAANDLAPYKPLSEAKANQFTDAYVRHPASMCWLTNWGRVTHLCVSKLTITGSDSSLSPGRRQAIIWTNAGILLIQTLRTNFIEILSKIHTFSFKKIHLKMSSAKWRSICLGLSVLCIIPPPFQVAKRASTGYDCRGQQTKHNYLSYFSIEVNMNSEIRSY